MKHDKLKRIERVLVIGLLLGWVILFASLQWYPWISTSDNLSPLPGYIVLRLTPHTMTLWIDGKKHSTEESGLSLPTGTHHIKAEAQGYHSTQHSIYVRGDDATMLRLKLKPLPVQVKIDSQPSGAQLILNGKPMGTTPFRGTLAPRWYAVQLSKDGYVTVLYNQKVLPNRPNQQKHYRLGGSTQQRQTDNATMLWIRGRVFHRGSTKQDIQQAKRLCQKGMKRTCPTRWFSAEEPQRYIKLKSYWIDRFEVTQQQYDKCVLSGQCKASEYASKPKQPITGVTWEQARIYCRWAGARLPTEAEWELAAKGPVSQPFPWGNKWSPKSCNHGQFNANKKSSQTDPSDGYRLLAPVGSFLKGQSPYRLHDMIGNVAEWVEDCYHTSYYRRSPEVNPIYSVKGCNSHTIRGGSYLNPPWELRTTSRQPMPPETFGQHVGFRCAKSATTRLKR